MAGKSFNDRNLAAEVRTLSLKKIKAVLSDEKNEKYGKEFQQSLLLRLAGTVLPRLNELTGEDGRELIIKFDPIYNAVSSEPKKSNSQSGEVQDSQSGA